MKRPASWQLEKQRTAKGLRELPLCEWCGIKRAMGYSTVFDLPFMLCPSCARDAKQRAQRVAAPRET